MDAQVGQILSSLEKQDLLDRTIVIWTTDHGSLLPRGKRELFDSGIQVPLIIRWPSALQAGHWKPGDLDERLISFVDLAPIVLSMAGVAHPDYLQGRDTIDPEVPPRKYIHASRDRTDEQDDRVRAVRDQRYKYLRYYRPGTAGATHISYRDQGRIMQALWSGLEQETLTDTQSLWFQPRGQEAFYDLANDSHEIVNLVDDPNYTTHLNRLRGAYTTWQSRVPDLSDESEAAMAARFWPDGVQPETRPPAAEFVSDGKLVLKADPAASIGYRIDQGAWQLFSGDPIALDAGSTLSARAVRYGHAESPEFTITPAAR
jgi:N-sulfoglucosamine sulfohydrolase